VIYPSGCYTEKRRPTGVIALTVDEDRYQELQRRRAEEKAAKVAQGSDEDGEGGEEEEDKTYGAKRLGGRILPTGEEMMTGETEVDGEVDGEEYGDEDSDEDGEGTGEST
jgi:hypothetical protein